MEGRLREVLGGLLERGVRGAALLRPDGLLLEAVGEASGAAERAAALWAWAWPWPKARGRRWRSSW